MTDEITLTGLYLTLVGLLASFFWLNLGSWIRDLASLQSEATALKDQTGADANSARLEIKHKLAGVRNPFHYVLTLVVAGFAVFLLIQALALLSSVSGKVARNLGIALWVFLIIFIGLTASLVLRGAYLISDTADKIESKARIS